MSDGLSLAGELAHYRDRWRATERIVDQRLTMLIAALGSVMAATVAVLARNAKDTPVDIDLILGSVWLLLSFLAEGIFFRLIRARNTIHRNIAVINHLRAAASLQLPTWEQQVLMPVYAADSRLPRPFYFWGSTTASALVQGAGLHFSIWFFGPGIRERMPLGGVIAGLSAFALNMAYYWVRCRAIDLGTVGSLPPQPPAPAA
ncbi:MAG: hypothetical protein JWN67_2500 [Actinomycetia bacterium]|nr:hypothetical protein [Actinomycetes bacterium]